MHLAKESGKFRNGTEVGVSQIATHFVRCSEKLLSSAEVMCSVDLLSATDISDKPIWRISEK